MRVPFEHSVAAVFLKSLPLLPCFFATFNSFSGFVKSSLPLSWIGFLKTFFSRAVTPMLRCAAPLVTRPDGAATAANASRRHLAASPATHSRDVYTR